MRKKRQPSAEVMRTQLALAADEIICLRGRLQSQAMMIFALRGKRHWWKRLLRWFK